MYDGKALEAVQRFKYSGRVILTKPLGAMMAEAACFSKMPEVVLPVPLHTERLRARGFNQSLMLSKALARRLSLRLDYMNLKRTRMTRPQVDLKIDERRKNVSGAFGLKRPDDVRDKRVLLVDDVYTTRSTVKLRRQESAVSLATSLRLGSFGQPIHHQTGVWCFIG